MSTPVTALNPYWILAKVAFAAAVVGGAFFYGHHLGYSGEKLVYDKYVSDQKAAAESQVAANKSALAFQQSQFTLQMNQLQQEHTDEVSQISKQRDAAIADRDQYAGQLRKFLAARPGRQQPVVPVAGSGSAGTDATGGPELSDGVSVLNQWLIDNLSRADQYAVTLNYAEQVIQKDREVCNGTLPGVTAK